ncbi:hypothetical protein GW17_00021501, partial [Ensete ventricosum]
PGRDGRALTLSPWQRKLHGDPTNEEWRAMSLHHVDRTNINRPHLSTMLDLTTEIRPRWINHTRTSQQRDVCTGLVDGTRKRWGPGGASEVTQSLLGVTGDEDSALVGPKPQAPSDDVTHERFQG